MPRLRIVFAVVFIVLGSSALAHEYRLGDIAIGHPFAQATLPSARTGAAYLSLANSGAEDDRLLSASSGIAEKIEIHEVGVTGDVVTMRPAVDGVSIPAGQKVELAPGGYHLMLTGLKKPLVKGERVPIVLKFQHAGEIAVELAVEAATVAREGDGGHNHH